MHRWQALVVAVATVTGAAGLGAVVRGSGSTDQEMELVAVQTTRTGAGQYSFTVRATPVEDLHPGARRHLRLTLTNPFTFDLRVTDMRADLIATSRPGCAPISSNLEVHSYTGGLPVRVPAKDSDEAGVVPLYMPNTVANECQQATFTIAVHADATRDGQ